MKAILTVRVPEHIKEKLEIAAHGRNITMTKYVLRILLLALMKEGHLDSVPGIEKLDCLFL